ncbi:MAG: YihY/virulence factor BrkB family protein [Flavobacteriales bacterium]|nr:YihY/virulence factor BrkB family protein [Flavobacteriales bacterium]
MERLKRKVIYSRPVRSAIRTAQRIALPGFEGFSIYQVGRFFFASLLDGNLITRASAISFKLFLAFFPGVLVLLTLIPFIPIADLQVRLLLTFQELMPPAVYDFAESTLHDLVVKKHGTLLSVSFLVGVYMASNSIDAILIGFSGSSNLDARHSPLKQRLLSLALLLAISVLMIIAIPLLTLTNWIIQLLDPAFFVDHLRTLGLFVAKYGISLLLLLTSIALLFHAGDPKARRFKLFTPGSILTLFLVLVVSKVLAFVFGRITDYNALYGSIGAILAVQLYIYVNMIVLLIGFELNTSIARARRKHSRVLTVPAPHPVA